MVMEIKCTKCFVIKPASEFYTDKRSPDGYQHTCKMCRKAGYEKDGHGRELARLSYQRGIGKQREKSRQFRFDNPEKTRNTQAVCYIKKRDKYLEKAAAKYREVKAEVFNAYGGFVCACCGETIPGFLTIDHINGGGSKHRKEIEKGKGGCQLYYWLKREGYPPGYQVLCYNCNCGRAHNNGICPHMDSKVC